METYSLLVNFLIDFDYQFPQIDLLKEIKIGSFVASIEKLGGASYRLKFGPFRSESDAENYYPKIQSYLSWISLNCEIGIKFPKKVHKHRSDILASSDSDEYAYVINDGACKTTIHGFSLTVVVTPSAQNIISSFEESMNFNYPEKIQENNKLSLALELYSNYFFEGSGYAKFITLVNILEALAPSLGDEKISTFSINKLNDLVIYAENQRDGYCNKSNEYSELDSLIKRIKGLENKATTTMLLNYIKRTVESNSDLGKPNEIKNAVDDAYHLRSRLLHGDKIDQLELGKHLGFLNSFVPKLLKTLYVQSAT
jgi:hypothetical protein